MIQHEQIMFAQDAQQLLRTKTQKRKATEMRKTKESSKYQGNGSQLFLAYLHQVLPPLVHLSRGSRVYLAAQNSSEWNMVQYGQLHG